jgi:hypothetical protein
MPHSIYAFREAFAGEGTKIVLLGRLAHLQMRSRDSESANQSISTLMSPSARGDFPNVPHNASIVTTAPDPQAHSKYFAAQRFPAYRSSCPLSTQAVSPTDVRHARSPVCFQGIVCHLLVRTRYLWLLVVIFLQQRRDRQSLVMPQERMSSLLLQLSRRGRQARLQC